MQNNIQTKKLILPLFAVALLGGAVTAGVVSLASAQTTPATGSTTTASGGHQSRGVAGTITAINGSTITLTGKNGTTYTVDATTATIAKTSTINVSGLAVGDTLMVGGTVNGTSVSASHIMDGAMPTGAMGMGGGHGPQGGMGQGVMGTVSAVNGTTLTVTAKNGTAYTVDATSAKVMKGTAGSAPAASTLSSVAVGDTVAVRGTVSGTSVTATTIMDGVFGRGPRGGMKNPSGSANPSAAGTATTQ